MQQISRKADPKKWHRSEKTEKKLQKSRQKRPIIESTYLEAITAAQISEYLAQCICKLGLAPRTANRYREVLNRLFNWSTKQGGVKLPGDKNPVANVERYRQRTSEIKTAKNRAVPISSTLRSYLDEYCPRPSNGGWYFPSPQGQHYDPDNFSSDFRRVQKKAGLKWSCLDFRHSFGSHLAMKGESLYKISTLMGNSPEICRTHYAALIPEQLGDCVEFGETKKSLQAAIP